MNAETDRLRALMKRKMEALNGPLPYLGTEKSLVATDGCGRHINAASKEGADMVNLEQMVRDTPRTKWVDNLSAEAEAEVIQFPASPFLAIPQATRYWIVVAALVVIGGVSVGAMAMSLNDMAEAFQAALSLAAWKSWVLATLADILFMGVESLCIFAPPEIVARRVTSLIRLGAIGISMGANAYSLARVAPLPWIGVAAGVVMPLIIAGCTYVIGYAVHKGGR